MADPSPDNNDALHDQRDWLLVTLSCIGDAVITTDLEGRVTFLNPVAEFLTGWTQEAALTGWGQDEDRRRSQEAGFNFHIVKPVELSALEKLLDGSQVTT